MTDETSVDALLREAAEQLRESTDAGWQRAHQRILRGLLLTLRPSTPLRGTSSEGHFRVASTVLVSRLRAVLDARSDLQVLRVGVETGEGDALTGVTLAISVAYLTDVATVADAARDATRTAVQEALGEGAEIIDVVVADVHSITSEDSGGGAP